MWITLLLAVAQPDEIPPLVRASPHFSGAIGDTSLTITATATPLTVKVGEEIMYVIGIKKVRNPSQVSPPPLDLPAFEIKYLGTRTYSYFDIAFMYMLRPRTADIKEIPGFRFDYYMPEAAENNRLRTKYVPATPIVVNPRESTATPAFVVPERFQTLLEDRGELPRTVPLVAWIGVPLSAAIIVPLWISMWRTFNPRGARLAQIQRHRAVRTALRNLKTEDPQEVFREYLQQRYPIPASRMTAMELHAALVERGLKPESADAAFQFLRDADDARFGGNDTHGLAERARDAILALEAAP